MIGREDVAVLVLRRRRPLLIFRRDFGRSIQTLTRILRQNLAQQTIAFPVAVGPCGIEKIAAEIDRQLQGLQRLAIFRAAPATHAPQSVGNVTYFETGTAELAVFHGSPWDGELPSAILR